MQQSRIKSGSRSKHNMSSSRGTSVSTSTGSSRLLLELPCTGTGSCSREREQCCCARTRRRNQPTAFARQRRCSSISSSSTTTTTTTTTTTCTALRIKQKPTQTHTSAYPFSTTFLLFALLVLQLQLQLSSFPSFANAADTSASTAVRIDADWNSALLTGRTDDGDGRNSGGRVVATASMEFGSSSLLELEELTFQGLPPAMINSNTTTSQQTEDSTELLLNSALSKFRKVRTIVKGDLEGELMSQIVWHGVEWNAQNNDDAAESGAVGFATLVQNATTGDLCGTLTTRTTTYALVTTAFGELEARAVPWKDHYRDEDHVSDNSDGAAVVTPRGNSPLPTQDNSVSFAPSSSQETSLFVSSGTAYNVTTTDSNENSNINNDDGNNNNRIRKRHLPGDSKDDEDGITTIDILVVVSNRAMCEYAGVVTGCSPLSSIYSQPILQKISLLEAEFNNAMELNKIKNIRVRIADIRILPATNGEPENEIYTDTALLSYMANDANIQNWRNEVYADAVTMIASADPNNQACGRAQLGGTHAVTSYECLESYSWTHEVGHLFGCRHNREDVPNPDAHPYGFGYRKPSEYRTVMAYSCLDDGDTEECPRIPVFSASDVDYKPYGKLGDDEHDNARLIREAAPALAAQLQAPTPSPTPAPTKSSSRDKEDDDEENDDDNDEEDDDEEKESKEGGSSGLMAAILSFLVCAF